MTLDTYREKVLDCLEYMGYPELVAEFEPEDIAKSFVGACNKLYAFGVSTRSAALVIFGLTWEMQIIPRSKLHTKH